MIFLPKRDKVKYDIVYDGIDTKGMIVRDEQFIDLSGYEKLYFNNVVEGQFVEAGTDISLLKVKKANGAVVASAVAGNALVVPEAYRNEALN